MTLPSEPSVVLREAQGTFFFFCLLEWTASACFVERRKEMGHKQYGKNRQLSSSHCPCFAQSDGTLKWPARAPIRNAIFHGNVKMDEFKSHMNLNQEELEQWDLARCSEGGPNTNYRA